MNLRTRRPPYSADEIERLARAFARREAWGCFYGDEAFARAFGPALARHSRPAFLAELEAGALYAFGLARPGRFFADGAMPTFEGYGWLDAASLRAVLGRARAREAVRGQLGRLPPAAELETVIEAQEKAREQALAELRAP